MKKILIINQEQFGYHSDTYYYCKYLARHFDIAYICWDYKMPRLDLDGSRVIYVTRKGNLFRRNLRFITAVLSEIRNLYDFHFIKYFRGASLIRLFSGKRNIIIDIRSGATNTNPLTRMVRDICMRIETACFPYVSAISESLKKRLKLPAKTIILPLGADIFSKTRKTFSSLDLLYVGTLYSRNIEQTLHGFAKFFQEYGKQLSMRYTIIGTGYFNEENELKNLAEKLGISHKVTLTGYIEQRALSPYFDSHNLGVSYIPITPYYDAQPPTKNFEYLLSGMPVIATSTYENRASINSTNGLLIQDTPDGFYKGLVRFMEIRQQFDSDRIRDSAADFTWDKIVRGLHRELTDLIKRQ